MACTTNWRQCEIRSDFHLVQCGIRIHRSWFSSRAEHPTHGIGHHGDGSRREKMKAVKCRRCGHKPITISDGGKEGKRKYATMCPFEYRPIRWFSSLQDSIEDWNSKQ